MGWLFRPGWDLKSMIAELCEDKSWENSEGEPVELETIDREYIMSTPSIGRLWTLKETRIDGDVVSRTIVLYLCQYHPSEGWGYKDVEETMGPVDKDCPVRLIDQAAEPPNEYAREWREQVREAAS